MTILVLRKDNPQAWRDHAVSGACLHRGPTVGMTADIETKVAIVESVAALAPYAAQWDDLAAHASEPNMFYERWALVPALEHLPGKERVHMFLVTDGARLLGLMPIVRRNSPQGLPGRYVANWRHIHCFAGTPLMRKGKELEFFSALFAWAQHERLNFVKLCNISWTDRLARLIEDYTRNTGRRAFTLRSYERAVLDSPFSGEAYLQHTLSPGRRKDIRRNHRRLEKKGAVRCREVGPDDDIARWIDDFIAIEKSGWKGRAGTALACNPRHEAFFARMTRNAHAEGKSFFHRLEAAGKTVAITANYRSGHRAWAFKVAIDETYRKCSPGLLLEIEGIKIVLDNPALDSMDSCAQPDNSLINKLLTGRLAMRDQMISVSPGAPATLRFAVLVEFVRRAARDFLKRTYYAAKPAVLKKQGRRP